MERKFAKVVTVSNNKGGVGKTTTVVNTAFELSNLGFKVLVIDLDQQANTTRFFGCGDSNFYVGDVLLNKTFNIRDSIYKCVIDDVEQKLLDVLPARRDGNAMAFVEMQLQPVGRRDFRLSDKLEEVKCDYDYILIDTAPINTVLSLNSLLVTDYYVIPTEFGQQALDGIQLFLDYILSMTNISEENLRYTILPWCIDKRCKTDFEYGMEYLFSFWPKNISKSVIWYRRKVFNDSERMLCPVSYLHPSSVEASFYYKFAKELINYVK